MNLKESVDDDLKDVTVKESSEDDLKEVADDDLEGSADDDLKESADESLKESSEDDLKDSADEALKEVSVKLGDSVELACSLGGTVQWTRQRGNINKDSVTIKVGVWAEGRGGGRFQIIKYEYIYVITLSGNFLSSDFCEKHALL